MGINYFLGYQFFIVHGFQWSIWLVQVFHLMINIVMNCISGFNSLWSENFSFRNCPIWLRDSKEREQAMKLHQKSDFVKALDSMRIPLNQLYVLFCRMINLPKVHQFKRLISLVWKNILKELHRWWSCHVHIYFDDHLSSMNVTEENIAFKDPHWRVVNERFENQLQSNPDYITFRGQIFFCVG